MSDQLFTRSLTTTFLAPDAAPILAHNLTRYIYTL
jgi:hypothetical protein